MKIMSQELRELEKLDNATERSAGAVGEPRAEDHKEFHCDMDK